MKSDLCLTYGNICCIIYNVIGIIRYFTPDVKVQNGYGLKNIRGALNGGRKMQAVWFTA